MYNMPSSMTPNIGAAPISNAPIKVNGLESAKQYSMTPMIEELDGAKEYFKEACKLKEERPDWAKSFYEMGNAELDHSRALNKMFNEHFKSLNTKPELVEYMEPFKDMADEVYIQKMGEIRYIQDKFNGKQKKSLENNL